MYVYTLVCINFLWHTGEWHYSDGEKSLKWSRVHDVINVLVLITHAVILSLGNSHVALTLLCRSSGSNGRKPQQTFGLSPPMAAGAAKGCMYIYQYQIKMFIKISLLVDHYFTACIALIMAVIM